MAKPGTYSRETMALKPMAFESERLAFRPMVPVDEPEFWTMVSDERVLKYIGLPVETDRAASKVKTLEEFENGRFKFFYAVLDKSRSGDAADKMIGIQIFRPMEDGCTVEIGYWLMPDYWGQGFATEGAKAVVDHCCPLLGVPRRDISAMVMIGNDSSRHVLEKVGLTVTSSGEFRGFPTWFLNWADPIAD